MITVNSMQGREGGTTEMELKGLSTDTKPTETFSGRKIGVNSLFLELDTGDVYYFTGSEWEAMSMSGGGSGGAGLPEMSSETSGKFLTNNGSEASWGDLPGARFRVPLTESEGIYSSEVTIDEISAAYNAGKTVEIAFTVGGGVSILPLVYIKEGFALFSATTLTDLGEAKSVVIYCNDGEWDRVDET